MEFSEYKEKIQYLMDEDYKSFIMALISIEKGIDDIKILEELYDKYMENDDIALLSDAI